MYGFNKVNDMIHSNLRNENQMWEFRHPHFRRGEVEDLRNIKRKSVRSLRATAPLSVNDSNDMQRSELLHQNYANLVDRVTRMNTSFESLLDEVSTLRDTVLRQHQVKFFFPFSFSLFFHIRMHIYVCICIYRVITEFICYGSIWKESFKH